MIDVLRKLVPQRMAEEICSVQPIDVDLAEVMSVLDATEKLMREHEPRDKILFGTKLNNQIQ